MCDGNLRVSRRVRVRLALFVVVVEGVVLIPGGEALHLSTPSGRCIAGKA